MTRLSRFFVAAIAAALTVSANADVLYSGTWDVSGQSAGTVTLRISGDRISGALVGNAGRKRTGHLKGSISGKRFKVTIRLSNGLVQEFQGNITHDDYEAHMDGLLYVGNKPKGSVRLTSDVARIVLGR